MAVVVNGGFVAKGIYSQCSKSAKLMAAWHSFVSQHRIADWSQVTKATTDAFHAYVSSLHNSIIPEHHWTPQGNLITALRDTFNLQYMVDGLVWPMHFQHHIHPSAPQHPDWSAYLGSEDPVKCLWCIQTTPQPLEPLLARGKLGLPTTAIIICPDDDRYHERLMEYTDIQIHLLARVPKFTIHDTDDTRYQNPYTQHTTLFWIHVQSDPVLQHTVLSSLRPMIKKAKGEVHPIPEAWALHESKDTIYRRLWYRCNETTHSLKNRQGWTNKDFAHVYDARAQALQWAPQPRLRKVWHLRRHRTIHGNRTSRWIYAVYSTRISKVYVGQTGDRGTLKSIIQ